MTKAQFDSELLDRLNRPLQAMANQLLPFYRRYPYRGQLWISEIDLRITICQKHRFVYNRLPKTANSTISASLAEAVQRHGGTRNDFRRPSRIGPGLAREITGFTKIVFVRDPFARTLSAYRDKIVRRTRQANRPLRWMAARGITAPDFEDFCRYLDEVGLYDDNHWAPQTAGLVFEPAAIDFLGRFETLEDGLSTLHQQLFGAAPEVFKRAGPPATGAEAVLGRDYTPVAEDIVRRLFHADFEAFGYDPHLRRANM